MFSVLQSTPQCISVYTSVHRVRVSFSCFVPCYSSKFMTGIILKYHTVFALLTVSYSDILTCAGCQNSKDFSSTCRYTLAVQICTLMSNYALMYQTIPQNGQVCLDIKDRANKFSGFIIIYPCCCYTYVSLFISMLFIHVYFFIPVVFNPSYPLCLSIFIPSYPCGVSIFITSYPLYLSIISTLFIHVDPLVSMMLIHHIQAALGSPASAHRMSRGAFI
jgi:hypothetical protein